MPPERDQDSRLEVDGVLVRQVGGQIYLIEEGAEDAPWDEEVTARDRGGLSELINRH